MNTTFSTAAWFLPFVFPICIFVAWNDMKFMKIPNVMVLAMLGVFVVIGPIALDLDVYLWRYLHFAVILVIGFLLNTIRAFGAGDAKFAAAMAPFIPLGDATMFLIILAATLLAAFFTHRTLRQVPQIRLRTPDWESWDNNQFPMGLALGAGTVIYFLMALRAGY